MATSPHRLLINRPVPTMTPAPFKLLTIAGSDSGGAAGAQADLKTFTALGAYGMSVLTVVTAQNSEKVAAVHGLPPEFVAQQLEMVLQDYGADAAKTGFLATAPRIEAIASVLSVNPIPFLVVDPVLVNQHGASMFPPDVATAYQHHLFPLATLITPNKHEAVLLTGDGFDTMEARAEAMIGMGATAVLITGINAANANGDATIVDLLFDGNSFQRFESPRIETNNVHGSGDTLSAAIATLLAAGLTLAEACRQAHQLTLQALRAAAGWQLGNGHGPLAQWMMDPILPAIHPPNFDKELD